MTLLHRIAILKLILAKYMLILALLTPAPLLGGVSSPLLGVVPAATRVVQVASTTATTTQTYGFYDTFKSATGTLIVKTSTLSSYNTLSSTGTPTCGGCGTWLNSFHGYY